MGGDHISTHPLHYDPKMPHSIFYIHTMEQAKANRLHAFKKNCLNLQKQLKSCIPVRTRGKKKSNATITDDDI